MVVSIVLWRISFSNAYQKMVIDDQTKSLIHKNAELESQHQQIMDSIEYAQKIQLSILPKSQELGRAFKDHFAIWKPVHTVGGDFYWFRESKDGYYIGVIDCTGHGVPGALMTMAVSSSLNRIVNSNYSGDPSQVLNSLNTIIKNTINKDGAKGYRGMDDGLDIGLCHISKLDLSLRFAGAGIALYIADKDKVIRVKPDSNLIGYRRSKENHNYRISSFPFNDRQNFYMASDGFEDQNGGERNKCFGRKALIAAIDSIKELPMDQQGKMLMANLDEHMGPEDQRDDITIVGFNVLKQT